jgi:hypothetical protein
MGMYLLYIKKLIFFLHFIKLIQCSTMQWHYIKYKSVQIGDLEPAQRKQSFIAI